MFGFGKKKKVEETVVQEKEPEYTCLFCGQKFKASEILFGWTLKNPDPEFRDNVFNSQLRKYQEMYYVDEKGVAHGLMEISRRMIQKDTCEVIKREPNGLPVLVRGYLEKSKKEQTATGDSFGFFDMGSMGNDNDIDEEEVQIVSSERLCPRCHFTLPEGFATDKVIQVGLLGGSRSGKTTYMAVVTEYLQKKMGMLNSGLEMAQVELLPECQKYQEALYLGQKKPIGATATTGTGFTFDKRVMPIVLRIKPVNTAFKPFFLVLQDIPGEYLLQKNSNLLLSSSIPKSTDLIMLVDINHFIRTAQQDGDEFGDYCPFDVSELFANVDSLSAAIPQGQLHSVQCALTKLDFWEYGDRERLNGAIFTNNCDDYHRQGIDVIRLGLVHDQINELLNGIGGNDQSGLLDNLIKTMDLEGKGIHQAYTAVASRIVPDHEDIIREQGADYQASLNVLEPLMNIFEWEDLLPEKAADSNQ